MPVACNQPCVYYTAGLAALLTQLLAIYGADAHSNALLCAYIRASVHYAIM